MAFNFLSSFQQARRQREEFRATPRRKVAKFYPQEGWSVLMKKNSWRGSCKIFGTTALSQQEVHTACKYNACLPIGWQALAIIWSSFTSFLREVRSRAIISTIWTLRCLSFLAWTSVPYRYQNFSFRHHKVVYHDGAAAAETQHYSRLSRNYAIITVGVDRRTPSAVETNS